VSIPGGFVVNSLASPIALVEHMSPAIGRRVSPGAVVRLEVARPACAIGSPGVPVGTLPRYTVPSSVGDQVCAAQHWVAHKTLYFTEHVGPLGAGSAKRLDATDRLARASRKLTRGPGSRSRSLGAAGVPRTLSTKGC
jgi:hypothetical protein